MYKLKITPAAASDLAEINAYISTQLHNPQAARRIVKNITHDLRLLQQNPHLGFSVSAKIGRETNLRALLSEIISCSTALRMRRYRFPAFWTDGRIICGSCLELRKKSEFSK